MIYTEFPASCAGALLGSILTSLFLLRKAQKDGNSKLLFYLSIDATLTTILPVGLCIQVTLSSVAVQRLFLTALLFQIANCMLYLLFPSTAKRLLIPFASLFLLFGVLRSLLSLTHEVTESEISLFALSLQDQINLVAFTILYAAVAIPFFKSVISRIDMLFTSRHLNNLCESIQTKREIVNGVVLDGEGSPPPEDSKVSFLRSTMNLIREGKYGLFIQSCNAEVERIILSRSQPYSTKPEALANLQEGISLLESKGIMLPKKSILRLRELCSALATSSKEVTIDEAKWAAGVTRKTAKLIGKYSGSHSQLMKNQRPKCDRLCSSQGGGHR